MARYCIAGCGRELKNDDGSTNYKKQFCSKECRDHDKAQRMSDKRSKLNGRKNCPTCGQLMPHTRRSAANG